MKLYIYKTGENSFLYSFCYIAASTSRLIQRKFNVYVCGSISWHNSFFFKLITKLLIKKPTNANSRKLIPTKPSLLKNRSGPKPIFYACPVWLDHFEAIKLQDNINITTKQHCICTGSHFLLLNFHKRLQTRLNSTREERF